MEIYSYIYSSDEGEEQQNNIKIISKKPEKMDNGKNGFCITLSAVPLVFSAYVLWLWKYLGPSATNILLKISPYHWWVAPPTFNNLSLSNKAQLDFLIAAFQKRIVNQTIRQQEHKLYSALLTCEAEKKSSLTHNGLKQVSKHIMQCINVAKGNYYPTLPPPEKCNYNMYTVYKRQRQIMKMLHKIARKGK